LLSHPKNTRHLALIGSVAACMLASVAPAAAQTGGSPSPGDTAPPPVTVPGARAKLLPNGTAIAPAGAPPAVLAAIDAGNRIRKKPYIYGGGHQSFISKGYDCSGAVSYVLNAAGLLESPLPSGDLMNWGSLGRGAWITVFANKGHAYMVVAGLRFDTSAVGEPINNGSGPRWRSTKRKATGYTSRYALGL
jgi:hypothetical protein